MTVPAGARSETPAVAAAPTLRYHTFWSRFFAAFIDGFVLLPVNVGDRFLLSPDRSPLVIIPWACFSYASFPIYLVLMHARYGQTLGKMATKVKVLDLSEQRLPSLRQACLRDIGDIVLNALSLACLISFVTTGRFESQVDLMTGPAFPLSVCGFGWFLLVVVTMLTNSKRRAIHDFIAGSVVVRHTRATAPIEVLPPSA